LVFYDDGKMGRTLGSDYWQQDIPIKPWFQIVSGNKQRNFFYNDTLIGRQIPCFYLKAIFKIQAAGLGNVCCSKKSCQKLLCLFASWIGCYRTDAVFVSVEGERRPPEMRSQKHAPRRGLPRVIRVNVRNCQMSSSNPSPQASRPIHRDLESNHPPTKFLTSWTRSTTSSSHS
jgi:hypothetical protein